MSRRKLRPRSDPGGRRGVGSSWEKGLHLEKNKIKTQLAPSTQMCFTCNNQHNPMTKKEERSVFILLPFLQDKRTGSESVGCVTCTDCPNLLHPIFRSFSFRSNQNGIYDDTTFQLYGSFSLHLVLRVIITTDDELWRIFRRKFFTPRRGQNGRPIGRKVVKMMRKRTVQERRNDFFDDCVLISPRN